MKAAGRKPTITRAERRRQQKTLAAAVKTIPRKCGECTACCTLMEVAELSKPQRVACSYANDGCSIYRDRPHSCRTWYCGWMLGLGRDEDRPDKSGFVVAPPSLDNGCLWTFFATTKNATVSTRAIAFLNDLRLRATATKTPYGISVVMGENRVVFIPPEWAAFYKDKELWETDPTTGKDMKVVLGDRLPWLHNDNGPQLTWSDEQ